MTTLKKLKDPYVLCRTRRHRWSDIPDDDGVRRTYEASSVVIRIASQCDRCTTQRFEAWNALTGDILFVDYKYPEDYSLAGEGMKPWDLRKEYLARNKRAARNGKQNIMQSSR